MKQETQPIKTKAQIIELYDLIHSEFRGSEYALFDILSLDNNFNIYQLRNETGLISNLFLTHERFTDISLKQKDVICLFSIVTTEKYRQKGYAKTLITQAVNAYVKSHKLKNPLIALHLDPLDRAMNVNYALYYKFGFEKASLSKYGPSSFRMRLDEIDQLQNVRDAMRDLESSKEEGDKFCMFVEYENFMKCRNVDMSFMCEEGEELRRKLLSLSIKD